MTLQSGLGVAPGRGLGSYFVCIQVSRGLAGRKECSKYAFLRGRWDPQSHAWVCLAPSSRQTNTGSRYVTIRETTMPPSLPNLMGSQNCQVTLLAFKVAPARLSREPEPRELRHRRLQAPAGPREGPGSQART